jgi:hypothetical protein
MSNKHRCERKKKATKKNAILQFKWKRDLVAVFVGAHSAQ